MKQIDFYHVLLVDDEFHLRQSLRRYFEGQNGDFRVVAEAENGAQALDILKKVQIEVVITDIRMPVMDGLSLAKAIHEQYPDIRTLILTGYADFDYARTAIRYGTMDYILKPVSDANLTASLNRLRGKLQADYELPDDTKHAASAQEMTAWCVQYLQEHFREPIDLDRLALELDLQPATMTRLFHRYVGESPQKFVTNLRMREAKKLLSETTLSIQEVGEQVGYPDQFQFSKAFRNATGFNPTAYRKQGLP